MYIFLDSKERGGEKVDGEEKRGGEEGLIRVAQD